MKVKIIKTIRMNGAPTVQLLPGSLVELPEETAKTWCASGYARPVVETTEADITNVETAVMPSGKKTRKR
jgi:hypothetical protein